MFTVTNSSTSAANASINGYKVDGALVIDEDELETTNDSSFTSSSSSFSLAESNVLPATNTAQDQKKYEQKLMRGIMMSSHNVSSLNELDNNRLLLNAKIASANSRRVAPSQCDVVPNTATYSVDLSHASRDPLVAAAPSEVFSKNDIKVAIEIKQKKLQQQQMELEKKLKDLEAQEAHLESLEMATIVKSCQPIGPHAFDSGVEHNESIENSSCLTNSASTQYNHIVSQQNKLSLDDLKRIEFQNRLLNMNSSNDRTKLKCDEVSSVSTSSSSCFVDSSQKQIEDRKKEILKR